jgi:hypothetical protein
MKIYLSESSYEYQSLKNEGCVGVIHTNKIYDDSILFVQCDEKLDEIIANLQSCTFTIEDLHRFIVLKVEFANKGLTDDDYEELNALEDSFNSSNNFKK